MEHKRFSLNYKFFLPLISFLGTSAIITLRPVLVLYIRALGLSAFAVGIISSTYMLLRGSFSFISGNFSDKIGKRKLFLFIGNFGFIIGTILLFSVEIFKSHLNSSAIYFIVLFCRFLHGLSAGIIWPIAQVMVLESSPPEKRTFYTALYFNAGTFGFIFRDLIISYLGKKHAPLITYLYISLTLLIIQTIIISLVKETGEKTLTKKFKISFGFIKAFPLFFVIILTVGGLQGISSATIVLILNEVFKYGLGSIGIIFLINDFLRIILNQFISYIADKRGILRVLNFVLITIGLSSILMGIAKTWILFIIAFILTYSIAPSLVSMIRSFVSHKINKNELGNAVGILNMGANFSNVIFASISGLWYDYIKWKTGMFFIIGIIFLIVSINILNENLRN